MSLPVFFSMWRRRDLALFEHIETASESTKLAAHEGSTGNWRGTWLKRKNWFSSSSWRTWPDFCSKHCRKYSKLSWFLRRRPISWRIVMSLVWVYKKWLKYLCLPRHSACSSTCSPVPGHIVRSIWQSQREPCQIDVARIRVGNRAGSTTARAWRGQVDHNCAGIDGNTRRHFDRLTTGRCGCNAILNC